MILHCGAESAAAAEKKATPPPPRPWDHRGSTGWIGSGRWKGREKSGLFRGPSSSKDTWRLREGEAVWSERVAAARDPQSHLPNPRGRSEVFSRQTAFRAEGKVLGRGNPVWGLSPLPESSSTRLPSGSHGGRQRNSPLSNIPKASQPGFGRQPPGRLALSLSLQGRRLRASPAGALRLLPSRSWLGSRVSQDQQSQERRQPQPGIGGGRERPALPPSGPRRQQRPTRAPPRQTTTTTLVRCAVGLGRAVVKGSVDTSPPPPVQARTCTNGTLARTLPTSTTPSEKLPAPTSFAFELGPIGPDFGKVRGW